MSFILDIIILIFSAVFHEVAHGLSARSQGDKTAEYAGRLTLNPLAHIDLYGSIIMPIFLWLVSGGRFVFAYAKPVPYNPYNLRDQKWGPALVGLAGPGANFVIAFVMALLIRFVGTESGLSFFFLRVLVINVSLAVFNLIPIPPLDGSKVLYAILPPRFDHIKYQMERYGIILIFALVYFFGWVLYPIIDSVVRLFLSGLY